MQVGGNAVRGALEEPLQNLEKLLLCLQARIPLMERELQGGPAEPTPRCRALGEYFR